MLAAPREPNVDVQSQRSMGKLSYGRFVKRNRMVFQCFPEHLVKQYAVVPRIAAIILALKA